MADVDRGELDVESLGGETRTLTFRAAQVMVLGKRLETDALTFIARGGDQTVFIVEAVFAGLSRSPSAKKINPVRIADWLDSWNGDKAKLIEDILYAIARGKPEKEAKDMVQALDEMFKDGNQSKTPTPAG